MAKTDKKSRMLDIFLVVILLIGVTVFAFPFVSQYIYWQAANVEIKNFDLAKVELSQNEIDERIELAHAYNYSLSTNYSSSDLVDPYSETEIQEGKVAYARMLEVNEQIGYITIPKISVKLPMFAGTNEDVLQKGVGHLEGSSLPVGGINTHAILTAHRGLPTASLFTDLDQMEIDDIFYIDTIGGTLAYQVDQILVIEPTDFSELELVENQDYITLLTCTPYMINSHRLIVRAKRIAYIPEMEDENIEIKSKAFPLWQQWALYIIIFIIVLISFFNFVNNRNKSKGKDKG